MAKGDQARISAILRCSSLTPAERQARIASIIAGRGDLNSSERVNKEDDERDASAAAAKAAFAKIGRCSHYRRGEFLSPLFSFSTPLAFVLFFIPFSLYLFMALCLSRSFYFL